MTDRHSSTSVERGVFTQKDLAIATLIGRYVERRDHQATPCAADLLASAAELGWTAVDELRAVLAFFEAMRE